MISLNDLMETTRKYHDEKGIEIVFIDCLQMIDLAKGEVAAPAEVGCCQHV